MKTFEFSIVASGVDPKADDFEDRFYEAGCDDALVSFQRGHVIIDFAREAEDLASAISSAIEDVSSTGAKVDRVEPDPLVSLIEMAERADMTRAAFSHYAKGHRGSDFPSPVAKVTSSSPLWEWASVAHWLYKENRITFESALDAQIVKHANLEIEIGNMHTGAVLKQLTAEYT